MRRVGDIEVDHFVDFRLDDIFSLAMRKAEKEVSRAARAAN